MKLKEIAALCRKAKSVIVFDEEGRQWAGDGSAMYILPENIGGMTPDTLCVIFDIPTDKAAEFYTRRSEFPATFESGDEAEEDELLFDTDRRVLYDGADMTPLQTPDGKVFFIKSKYLKAVNDSENLRLTLRIDGEGNRYIAVKDGMFLAAIIVPIMLKPGTTAWLGTLYNGTVKSHMEIEG